MKSTEHHPGPFATAASIVRALCLLTIGLVTTSLMTSSLASADELESVVSPVYVDVYSGPGRGYPVFHALERDQDILIIKSRTAWFKVQTLDRYAPIEGWVHRDELYPNGSMDWDGLANNRWTWSGAMGDLDGAQSLDTSLGYRISENLGVELNLGQATGDFSDIQYAYLRANNALPDIWRITPYFALGAGALKTKPNTKLVQSEQRNDPSMLAGAGLRAYLTRNFFMRVEYNQHLVLTDRDTNEDVNQWIFGLTVSF